MLTEKSEIITFDSFQDLRILAAFTQRPLNLNFRNQSQKEFQSSLMRFSERASFPVESACFFNQVHGTNSIRIDTELVGCGYKRIENHLIESDSGFTDLKDAPIIIFTADCIPLFVTDLKGSFTALLHVGWRGAEAGIVAKSLLTISSQLKISLSNFVIGIGPSIRSCCYEVGAEFNTKFPGWVIRKAGKCFLDLTGFSKSTLNRFEIPDNHIFDSQLCTFCDSRFHSYRREGERAGRMGSVVMKLGA